VYELLPKFFACKRPLALISKDCFLAMFIGFLMVFLLIANVAFEQ
jgi:hypothetical protein